MCGRYGSWSSDAALAAYYSAAPTPVQERIAPSWNVAPGAHARVLVARPDRQLHTARWGLLPRWAKDPTQARRTFNARSETAAQRPSFREALASFRALVPVDCWYEWLREGHGRRPFALASVHGAPVSLAGLCSWWREPLFSPVSPDRPSSQLAPAVWQLTFTIMTRPAGPDLAWLHDREPVVLSADSWEEWLDPTMTDTTRATAVLARSRPALRWWELGAKIGSVQVDGPDLLRPRTDTPAPGPDAVGVQVPALNLPVPHASGPLTPGYSDRVWTRSAEPRARDRAG